MARQPAGSKTVIRAEEFKKFVAKLRIKSNDYKGKKQEVFPSKMPVSLLAFAHRLTFVAWFPPSLTTGV